MLKQEGPQLLPIKDLGKDSERLGQQFGQRHERQLDVGRISRLDTKTWERRLDPEPVGSLHGCQVRSTCTVRVVS
jgi:hypothetical protein